MSENKSYFNKQLTPKNPEQNEIAEDIVQKSKTEIKD